MQSDWHDPQCRTGTYKVCAEYQTHEQKHENSTFPVSCHFEGELLGKFGNHRGGSLEGKDGESCSQTEPCLPGKLLLPLVILFCPTPLRTRPQLPHDKVKVPQADIQLLCSPLLPHRIQEGFRHCYGPSGGIYSPSWAGASPLSLCQSRLHRKLKWA